MQSSQSSLIHDATGLYRLIEQIDIFLAEHESVLVYPDETQHFFSLVHSKAEKAKAAISQLILKAAKSPEASASRYGPELIIEKNNWRILHTYLKPAAHAHTLNTPAPLVRMATEDVRRIPGMQKATLVVLLTPELMYYHSTPQSQLSPDLVFVEVPYTQAPGFFTNLTIYHELGHYVYDRLADAAEKLDPFAKLVDAMERAFGEKLGPALPSPGSQVWAKGVLDSWTKEIFCDLFAVRHLGPSFSWALIDVLSLINLMAEGTERTFDEDHPAPALRFREQVKRLTKDGWWPLIQDLNSPHLNLMQRLHNIGEEDYVFEYKKETIAGFTEAFRQIVPNIHPLIEAITPQCGRLVEDFTKRRSEIEECLLHGVVPSHLLSRKNAASPLPVSFINAGYCFYLTRLPELMKKLQGQDEFEVSHRKKWIERLEAWTMKAIEDGQLLIAAAKGG